MFFLLIPESSCDPVLLSAKKIFSRLKKQLLKEKHYYLVAIFVFYSMPFFCVRPLS